MFIIPSKLAGQNSNYVAENVSDTLVLINKDIMVGKIKDMDKGVLTIETDYSDDDFKIKWLDVISIKSTQNCLILLNSGLRLNSFIEMSKDDNTKVLLTDDQKTLTVPLNSIVYIKPINDNFLSRFDASISIGFNFTKSNSLTQLTTRTNIAYTSYKWNYSAGYNSILSKQNGISTTKRTDGNLGIKYFIKNDWFLILSGKFLSNEEQKLKLRSSTNGGVGKYFVRSNKLYFGSIAGLGWNNERFNDINNTSRNSLEAFAGLELNLFDLENFSLLTNVITYPSITEKNRIRTDFEFDVKYDLPFEFFIKLGFTLNYDNKPINEASKSDYIFQSTIGWEL